MNFDYDKGLVSMHHYHPSKEVLVEPFLSYR